MKELPRKPEGQKALERAQAFDGLCAGHSLTPRELSQLAPSRVAEMLREAGQPMVDVALLPGWMKEYAATCGTK